jgi:large subunit ribosomal protein L21
MYAIIEDSGAQIKVSQGDIIKVAIRDLPAGAATITFDKVLMVGPSTGENGSTKRVIGTPLLSGAKVTGDVMSQEKTPRVMSWRFRRRKNITKRRGHRQDYLKVKITAIEA